MEGGTMFTTFELALIGGFVSLAATSLGAIGFTFFHRWASLSNVRWSIDFALGIMLSASAFSLIGPELLNSINDSHKLTIVVGALAGGMIFVSFTQKITKISSARLLLIWTLLLHNFPEGMGAGASLAGMPLMQSLPIQFAIAVQNIAEGFLMVLCLQTIGVRTSLAILGGIGSGVVELSGAVVAGYALSISQSLLPLFLAAAGGAMVMSVLIELKEALDQGRSISKAQMLVGLGSVPILNSLLGLVM
jgi:zinc transporter, ZIP family